MLVSRLSVAFVLSACLAAGCLADKHYVVVDLGRDGDWSHATAIGTTGFVAGIIYGDLGSGLSNYGFRWTPPSGPLENLGTFPIYGFNPTGVNAAGTVVGHSGSAIVVQLGGVPEDLFPGVPATARAINDAGQIVGGCTETIDGVEYFRPFVYSGGTKTILPFLDEAHRGSAEARAISANGKITGFESEPYPAKAFLYDESGMHEIEAFGETNYGVAVNNHGWVAGYSEPVGYGQMDSWVWDGTRLIDLGVFAGGDEADDHGSIVYGMNNLNQVVGNAWCTLLDGSAYLDSGFLWENGQMRLLNDCIDPNSGWDLYVPEAINDAGQIVGSGSLAGSPNARAFLLNPATGVHGAISLQEFRGDVTQVPVVVEIRSPGSTTVLETHTVTLDAGGTYTFITPLTGTYDVAVKASHWLRAKVASVSLTLDGVDGLNFALVNGDVNGDNSVNLPDLTAISRAWRSSPGSANWNPNADLNGDGAINLADWTIASRNWRKTGA